MEISLPRWNPSAGELLMSDASELLAGTLAALFSSSTPVGMRVRVQASHGRDITRPIAYLTLRYNFLLGSALFPLAIYIIYIYLSGDFGTANST